MKWMRPTAASRRLMTEQERTDDYKDYLARKEQERAAGRQIPTPPPPSTENDTTHTHTHPDVV